jgi:hypothetical protein
MTWVILRRWAARSVWAGVAPGVEHCCVYLESTLGDRCLLADRPGVYKVPRGLDQYFGGSWGQDFGVGGVRDAGQDVAVNGLSSQLLSSSKGVFDFGLLGSGGYRKIVFELDVRCVGDEICLDYPKFFKPESEPVVVHESGSTSALLWPNSAGLRFGQWQWGDGENAWTRPRVVSMGNRQSSALDWLCFDQSVLNGAFDVKKLEDLAKSFYDSIELEKLEELGVRTSSFVLDGGYGVLVNELAEVPPLACFPVRSRDAHWKDSGDWAQESWSLAQEPRYYVVSGSRSLQLIDEHGSTLTKDSLLKIPGWSLSQHSHAWNGAPGRLCSIMLGSIELGKGSAWHGYMAVVGMASRKRVNPWNMSTQVGHYHRVECVDGELVYAKRYRARRAVWDSYSTITRFGDCESGRMVERLDGSLLLGFSRKGQGVFEFASDDDGLSWGKERMAFNSGKYPTLSRSEEGVLVRAAFVFRSGDFGCGSLIGSTQYPGQSLAGQEFRFCDDRGGELAVADDSFHLVPLASVDGCWMLTVRIDGEEATSEWQSWDDCRTWRRV